MRNIIRIEKVKVVDSMKIIDFGLMQDGHISTQGIVTDSHIKRTLVLFNRFKWKLKDG